MKSVAIERTGWRDEALSRRHRMWGYDCPAVDIDFLLVEYDFAQPVALIEFKCDLGKMPCLTNKSFLAIIELCNRANVKFFLARYYRDFQNWNVTRLNKSAREFLPQIGLNGMSELEFVSLLYRLRGRPIPESIAPNGEPRFKPQSILPPVKGVTNHARVISPAPGIVDFFNR